MSFDLPSRSDTGAAGLLMERVPESYTNLGKALRAGDVSIEQARDVVAAQALLNEALLSEGLPFINDVNVENYAVKIADGKIVDIIRMDLSLVPAPSPQCNPRGIEALAIADIDAIEGGQTGPHRTWASPSDLLS